MNAATELSKDNGNLIGLTSSYETADGATHDMADVWFVADKHAAAADPASVDSAIAALNTPAVVEQGGDTAPGEVLPQAVNEPVASAALSGQAIDAIAQTVREPAAVDTKADLRSRVSGLAQAIGSFGGADPAENTPMGPRLDTSGGVAALPSPAALTVASMADVLKQFDANGNLLGAQPTTAAATLTKTLNLPGLQDPNGGGILSSGGK